ncbi:MAG: hypothetical protein QXI58_06345 [Candidatus Micrarchaeia archaeon]
MKGLSGYVLTIVIALILASIGLVIYWVFLRNVSEGSKAFSEQIIQEICKVALLKTVLGC